ncbi:hypothetical protein KC19_12G177200 [Ceratodon purpureus]|uniref:Uncharacterized protein n=1 Tax=Ceratodon purpureus TaxID=3225 RepID=A0A8T0GEB7_CERPU|nr:hypothetical protein KC19_12G177200 [Ceratodon purpureus]
MNNSATCTILLLNFFSTVRSILTIRECLPIDSNDDLLPILVSNVALRLCTILLHDIL